MRALPGAVQRQFREAMLAWVDERTRELHGATGAKAELARKLGISTASMSNLLGGKNGVSPETAQAFAAIAGKPVAGVAPPPTSGIQPATRAESRTMSPKFGTYALEVKAPEPVLAWLQNMSGLPWHVSDKTARRVVRILARAHEDVLEALAEDEHAHAASPTAGSVAAPVEASRRPATGAPPSPPVSTLASPQDPPSRRGTRRR